MQGFSFYTADRNLFFQEDLIGFKYYSELIVFIHIISLSLRYFKHKVPILVSRGVSHDTICWKASLAQNSVKAAYINVFPLYFSQLKSVNMFGNLNSICKCEPHICKLYLHCYFRKSLFNPPFKPPFLTPLFNPLFNPFLTPF